MKTILLVRHGQASFGEKNYDKLSPLGIQQAKLLGAYFTKNEREIDHVLTGTMVRQKESATYFNDNFKNIPTSSDTHFLVPKTSALFNEFNHEQVLLNAVEFDSLAALHASLANEDKSHRKLAQLFQQAMKRWHSLEHDNDVDNQYDETWQQFSHRCHEGLQHAINQTEDGQTTIVFTSGGVIASIVSKLLSLPTVEIESQMALAINRQIINSSVTTLSVSDNTKNGVDVSKNQLLSFGACEHLHLENETYLSWY